VGCLNLKIGQIFKEAFNKMDKQTQKLLLFQFKMDVENNDSAFLRSEFLQDCKSDPLHEWELMRYKYIHDYSKVTLLGFCSSCREAYPFQMDILEFMDLRDTFTLMLQANNSRCYRWQRIDCKKCSKKNSLLMIPTWLGTEGKDFVIDRD